CAGAVEYGHTVHVAAVEPAAEEWNTDRPGRVRDYAVDHDLQRPGAHDGQRRVRKHGKKAQQEPPAIRQRHAQELRKAGRSRTLLAELVFHGCAYDSRFRDNRSVPLMVSIRRAAPLGPDISAS